MKLNDHPTVKKYLKTEKKSVPGVVDYQWLREIIINAGADDVGFVEIDREDLSDQKDDIQRAFPRTKSIISGSEGESSVPKRLPHKTIKQVG